MAHKTKIQLTFLFTIALMLSALVPVLTSSTVVAQSAVTAAVEPSAPTVFLPDGRLLSVGGANTPSAELRIIDGASGNAVPLKESLRFARSGHTATMLPDGRVLVLGGVGNDGSLVREVEVSDRALQRFELLPDAGVEPRVAHTATVLTDGQLLVVGGRDAQGNIVDQAELWNSRTGKSEALAADALAARAGHEARLLADGRVYVVGGAGPGIGFIEGAIFDPSQRRFFNVDAGTPLDPATAPGAAMLAGSNPKSFERDVPVDTVIALRFSKPLDVTSVSDRTMTLIGPPGVTVAHVVAVEGGMLVFLTPKEHLFPGSDYTVVVSGAHERSGAALPFAAFGFDTAALTGYTPIQTAPGTISPPLESGGTHITGPTRSMGSTPPQLNASTEGAPAVGAVDDEDWTPNDSHRNGKWRTGRHAPHPLRDKMKEMRSAYTGATALAGQVLRLNGQPLQNVILSVGDIKTLTDDSGRFILNGLTPGRQELVIDARRDAGTARPYGYYVAGVDLKASKLNELRYTIWMPKIRAKDIKRIASPTKQETVITHPDAPGLELRIPPGTVIRDRDGNIVTELAITPVPVDQAPFPLPENFPVYFMIHPGGAMVQGLDPKSSRGIRVIYPNYMNAAPGTEARFWSFDPRDRGWFIYGKGKVSTDSKQVVPDPGVAIYDWMAFGYGIDNPDMDGPEPEPPPCEEGACCGGGPSTGGDPVDCFSGLFIHARTDMVIRDVMPIVMRRVYRPGDTVVRPFGFGATHPYKMYLQAPLINGQRTADNIDLILSNGARIRYRLVSGTPAVPGFWEHTESASRFYKSRLYQRADSPKSWEIIMRDGSRYQFSPHGLYLIGMLDRFGNSLELTDSAGSITRIDTPSGRYIELFYDASNRIQEIRSFEGRSVTYQYDPVSGMLNKVTYPDGTFEQYGYDGARRMTTVRDRRGNTMVTNEYDSAGRVSKQTLADGAIYLFSYVADFTGRVLQTDVTDPRGFVRRVFFNHPSGYPTSETRALGTSYAQTVTIDRELKSGRPLLITDALGRKTRYTYDLMGNVASITYLDGTAGAITEGFTWTTDFNQLATYTDPLNRITTLTYDSLGKLTQIQDPLNQITQVTMDDQGRLSQILDPVSSQALALTYDLGDLRSRNDNGRITTFQTDAGGRIVAVVNPAGEQIRYQYDLNDRLTTITNPQGGITQLSFDALGNLQQVIDPKGATTGFGFDSRNRVASKSYPTTQVETFAYDGRNNLIQRIDRYGRTTTYGYDPLNRLNSILFPDSSTTALTFDAGNRLRNITDSANSAANVMRDYDDLNRLLTETTALGTVGYTYDNASRRTTMSVSSQTSIGYGYDDDDRLRTITQTSRIAALDYDTAFRRTSGTVFGNLSYSYDQAGRITGIGGSFADTNLPSAMTASHDVDHRLNTQNSDTFTYDAAGNIATRANACGTTTYTWNVKGQLTQMQGFAPDCTSVNTSFTYDAFGRRQAKTINGVTTSFVYDGVTPVQEKQGALTNNLLTGPGIDEYLARADSAGARYFLPNHLGSTIALTDSSGAITTRYTYGPYGETTQSGEASTNAFQYTGRENDGTGLYYYRARYYDPSIMRFISQDPIRLSGGLNLYAYVKGNPAGSIDPSGLWTLQIGGTISGVSPIGIAVTFSGGIAIDGSGNVATYTTIGLGVGEGLGGAAGISAAISNATTVGDLSGPFSNGSFVGGTGAGGSVDIFGGASPNGPVVGAGATVGVGGGVGGSVGSTNTWINPIGSIKDLIGPKNTLSCPR